MAGTCGMMGGRRGKKRGGQPPEPTAPPKTDVPFSLTVSPKVSAALEASRINRAKTEKNKSGKGRKRTLKGGNGYGFTATPGDVINAGNIAWTPNMTSVPNGQPVVGSVTGGRRRTRRRRTASKEKRARARSERLMKQIDLKKLAALKGGGSVAGVGYGFAGTGARGIADAIAYPSNLPPSGAFAIPTGTR